MGYHNTADDILQEVPESEIPNVIKAMEKDTPKNFIMQQQLNIMLEYRKHNVTSPTQRLYRYGDIYNGVYLLKTAFSIASGTYCLLFLHTADTDLTGVSEALRLTSRVPWQSRGFGFQATHTRFTPIVQTAAEDNGIKDMSFYRLKLLWVPPEAVVDASDLPDDVYIGFLNESHVGKINNDWPHKFPGSDIYLHQQIKNNFGLGLFKKTDNALLSSAVCYHTGGINVLYSDPGYRNLGYADITVRHMVKEIRARGKLPFCSVTLENIPSYNLFTKIGFKEIWLIDYIYHD